MKVIGLKLYFVLPLLTILHCTSPDKEEDKLVLAFGSCNNQNQPQPMWDEIISKNPDAWIWLGDNIYGDTQDPAFLQKEYEKQKSNPDYQKLARSAKIIGTWDDHDYGLNDGGKGNPMKEESQKAFLRFMEAPKDDERWEREGIYSSETLTMGDLMVKLILLDARYFRDTIFREERRYLPNDSGNILGEKQWEWLEQELLNSNADIHIIGSGIQVLAKDHPYEKWANFPAEREKLLNLVMETGARGVIFISGDRHIGEISEINEPTFSFPIRDVTSSGLTHSYESVGEEPNTLRVGPLVNLKNFGLFYISKSGGTTVVKTQLRGLNDSLFYEIEWRY